MSGIFRHVDANGRVTYSDLPPSEPGRVDVLSSSGNRTSDEDARKAHKDAVTYIKEAQKRGPKIKDYLEYIQYLRDKGRFWRWEKAMQDLRREDPEAWVKLQKYPQFRPLLNRALGLQAGEKNLTAGVGLITGKYTGSVEKWLETTVKDMMKVDRWGPYADVLGAKYVARTAADHLFKFAVGRIRQGRRLQGRPGSKGCGQETRSFAGRDSGVQSYGGDTRAEPIDRSRDRCARYGFFQGHLLRSRRADCREPEEQRHSRRR